MRMRSNVSCGQMVHVSASGWRWLTVTAQRFARAQASISWFWMESILRSICAPCCISYSLLRLMIPIRSFDRLWVILFLSSRCWILAPRRFLFRWSKRQSRPQNWLRQRGIPQMVCAALARPLREQPVGGRRMTIWNMPMRRFASFFRLKRSKALRMSRRLPVLKA